MDLFEFKCDLYHELEYTYYDHIRKFILNGNIDGVKKLLEEVVIPDKILTYKILRHASVEILQVLIDAKIKKDEFVVKVEEQMSILQKNKSKDGIHDAQYSVRDLDFLGRISSKIESEFCDYYKMYLIGGLLKNEKGLLSLGICDLHRYYKNIYYYYGKILRDGLNRGDITFVTNCLSVFTDVVIPSRNTAKESSN